MKLLSIKETCQRYTFSRTTLWHEMKINPTFPKPIEVSKGRKAFVEAEIDADIAARIAARDGELAR
ncbi:helix-turn-helix transcriptional regulator [Aureimonas altamirensis]|uniref:helix-turn-helix transcriptional regulator n=1 Tax=Aureimonas altamirensis TaxID=370622 RepID=UPI0033362907